MQFPGCYGMSHERAALRWRYQSVYTCMEACHPQDTSPFLLFGTDQDTFDTDQDTFMLLVAWLPQNFPGSENTSPGLSSPTTQQTMDGQEYRDLEAEGPLKTRTEVTPQPRHFPQLL